MTDWTIHRKGAKGFEGLQVWQKSMRLAVQICKNVLPQIPSSEIYALTSQLRRAVQSIPANIAEGHGRYYFQDTIRYCYIARGSIEEVLNHLEYARQMEYLPDNLIDELKTQAGEIERMLHGYISHLKKTKQGQNEPGNRIADIPYSVPYHVGDNHYDPFEES